MPPPLASGRIITIEKKPMNEEIPDDFFDELADSEFIDDLVEKSRDSGRTAPSPSAASPRDSGSRDGSPQLARCLAEIDELQKKIQRRKRKLERDMVSRDNDSDSDLARERDRERKGRDRERDGRRSRSPLRFHDSYYRRHRSRSNERETERSRGRPYTSHRGRKSRSRSPPNRNNYNRGLRNNRNRSKSPTAKRSGSNHNSLTFLEELAQTFAERGQDFPEKDLIMQPHVHINQMQMAGPDPFFAAMNPHFPSTSAFPNQINPGYYGINPMSLQPGPYPPASMMPPVMNNLHEV